MLRIEPLSLPAPEFARYTYPRFRAPLTGEQEGDKVEAIGAYLDDAPVGLALLRHDQKAADGALDTRLASIMVTRICRRNGIARALVDAAMDISRRAGSRYLLTNYSDQTKGRDIFENFLSETGWTPPELLEFRLAGEADWTERAKATWEPALRRIAKQGYSSAPWSSISDAERVTAERLITHDTRFNFEIFERHCDPNISLVLRKHGHLIGWVLGEDQQEHGYYHYTNAYVAPEVQAKGWLIAGIYDVCRAQAAVYGPKSVALYETFGENLRMVSIMQRRLQPFALWTDSRYVSRRSLAAA